MVDTDRAAQMRKALVAQLRDQGKILSDTVEQAFLRVPREGFMPADTDLAVVYGYDKPVVTKRDAQDQAMSSVSAAYIQAAMLELAQLRPGMRVLEVGSGGLNAAYIAEVVGPEGRVVSIDIDPEVIDRAATALDATGYSIRVRVLVADAEHGVPDEAPFDAIIVTVGAWNIAPAWLHQLQPDGLLVVPLIMNYVTRVIGFRRNGDHLISTATEIAGFVPMQGEGSRPHKHIELTDATGCKVTLSFDSGAPSDPAQLDGVLTAGTAESWSGITIGHGVSFADLHLWLAWFLNGFCRLSAEQGTDLTAKERWLPFAAVRGAGLAYLMLRDVPQDDAAEFGVRAYGGDAKLAAAALTEQVQAWYRAGRHTVPTFTYWPTGSDHSRLHADAKVMDKTNGTIVISWPALVAADSPSGDH
ncbi:methyltransferase, FxLD system [Catellatospora citrea]|nr:methyltransferase, FxLD system [Catellatospora citrea]